MKTIHYSFIASADGQTLFGPVVPPIMPDAICAINGVAQNALVGDFTVSGGFYITLSRGVSEGDIVFGTLFI